MDFRSRAAWGATFDVSPVPIIQTPVSLLFIHHNVIPPTSNPSFDMLYTEQIDIGRFGKPSYDWAIHPSGVVLEGMTTHLSPDTFGHNSDSLSVMFMGNFETDQPTDAAMLAARELITLLHSTGLLTDGFHILGHRDVYPTACPGANLYPRIQELVIPPTITLPPSTSEVPGMNTVVHPDGTIVLTIIGTDNGIYTTRSHDSGATWGAWSRIGGTTNQARNPI